MTLLRVERLTAGYGHVEVLHGVDIAVGAGQIAALVGPNGAGKTTLLSAVMGLLAHGGTVALAGETMAGTAAMVAAGAMLVPETRALFTDMTVEDNLLLGGFRRWRGGARDLPASLAEVVAIFPRLGERLGQRAGTLSGGERQMLALGRALMGRPLLLLLDEPSLGLAPLIVRDIFRVIARLRDQGMAILLVEQNVRAALEVADHAYVLELGAVALAGPATELARDPRVIDTYLGRSQHSPGHR